MTVFGNYAQYYDLLYQDKDYVGETKFIHELIQNHAPAAKTILELGCGTANHALLLAKSGYQVHGVDMSEVMLKKATDRLTQISPEIATQIQLTQGDIRQVRLNQTFDVVLSLFHVISYQTTNADLLAAFDTIKQHLKPGGIALFDVWYGPAVLSDRPATRIKRLQDDTIEVTRLAEPVIYPNTNLVDVNYHVLIKDKQSGAIEELHETHHMRYLFQPELELVAQQSGMSIVKSGEWMTEKAAGFDTWGVYFVVKHS
jgi:SAM-dependent methyltransferase